MKFVKNPEHDADVRRLLQVFPDILPDGRCLTHEQIEAAITCSRLSSRYRAVVHKWRRVLLTERSVYLDGLSASGKGFVSLTPDEMVRYGNRGVRFAGRKLRKALAVVSLPNDAALSEDTRRYRGLLETAIAKITHEQRIALRDVSRSLAAPKQLPRAQGA